MDVPHQLGIKYWNDLLVNFKLESMYDYFKSKRWVANHPTHESHKIWSKRLVELYNKNKYEDEFKYFNDEWNGDTNPHPMMIWEREDSTKRYIQTNKQTNLSYKEI